MTVRVELHCHSTHSDGGHEAADVAAMAAEAGVTLFCLTDHDTCDGYEATRAPLEAKGCKVLRGLELSCREAGRTVHMLLYGLEDGPGFATLVAKLAEIREERRDRLGAICRRLRTLHIDLDTDAILARTDGRTPGRPDVARALVEAGFCKTIKDAFTRYLRDGGPADVSLKRLGVEAGLELGKAAGARASLAHPHTFGDADAVAGLFARYRPAGLEGIEAHNGSYGQGQVERWLAVARRFDLVPTAGSDFHGGDVNPNITGLGMDVDESSADRLLAWLGLS